MTPVKSDTVLLGAIVALLILSVLIHLIGEDIFALRFAVEDGLVEYATALGLLACSAIFCTNAGRLLRQRLRRAAVCTLSYALLFFIGAGEEISWGQRIFGWDSGAFFLEHNKQGETNLHNLVVGQIELAKTLFGNVLTLVILLYLVGLPLLYPRSPTLARLIDHLAIPVPGLRHAVLAIAASAVIAAMDQSRKWEVYELVFALLMLSIILFPRNPSKTR